MKIVIPKLIVIGYAAGLIGVAVWLMYLNLLPSHIFAMELGQDKPMISRLGPPPRVRMSGTVQEILEGPVYFTVRAPQWYRHATLTLVYRDVGLAISGVGVQMGEGFAFEVMRELNVEDQADGSHRVSASFDLTRRFHPKNVSQFLLELQPGATAGGKAVLQSVSVTFTR